MPTYTDPDGLFEQGIYNLGAGVKVFAGTTDDNFYIDLGAAFDSLNFRAEAGGGVLSAAQDQDDATSTAPDDVSGYNVNTIAIEVPVALLTKDGRRHSLHRTRGTPRHVRHHLAPPDHRAARTAHRAGPRPVEPGAAHGQPARQRAHHRHRIEGPVQHGRPAQRRAVRGLRPRPAARGRCSVRSGFRFRRRPATTCCRSSRTPDRSCPPARRRERSPTCCASTPASRRRRSRRRSASGS